MTNDAVLTEQHDRVLLITLNRPDAMNAINGDLSGGLWNVVQRLNDDAGLTAGVLTGAGRGFCSGMDLKAFARGEDIGPMMEFVKNGAEKPLIGAIEGFALAGGLELALSCDLLVAAKGAKLGIPEVKVGLFAAGGGLLRLPSRVGYGRAMEMAVTGDPITAEEGAQSGLIARLSEPGDAVADAMKLAERVARNAPLAVAVSKQLIRATQGATENEFWAAQKAFEISVFTSEDAKEGPQAFAEKRDPNWTGSETRGETMHREADYLVIGAGAMGMAFADVLMTETDASILLVDRGGRPGGHWNVAYPFVRLHQPSAFYGVNSRKLGSDSKDTTGWNAGLYELASGAEVVAYFDQVMHQQFLPSGRVQYFPMCQYEGDGTFHSLLSGETHHVDVAEKTVDTTYMNVIVPSMRPPTYAIAEGVRCEPPNALPTLDEPPAAYVIVGVGKTGIDVALWLLANGVDPDAITWIRPRDSWLLDRAIIQPGREFFDAAVGGFSHRTEAAARATSVEDLFERLETTGQLLRLDPDATPTMYRCATVTQDEAAELRRITDVVRLGRVQEITQDEIVLDEGSVTYRPGALFIDCTADGLERRPVVPVFDGDTITVQTVRTCQQVFSSAFVAHIEADYDDEAKKNELCTVVPHPDSDIDWLRTTLGDTLNAVRWQGDADLQDWLMRARLDGLSGSRGDPDAEQLDVLVRILDHAPDAMTNLERLLGEISV